MDGVGQHGGHRRAAAGGGPHPQHIVVAPLDVHIGVLHQGVQNDVRPGPPVEQVPHHVELVHHHALDDPAHRLDEVLGPVDVDDGVDDVLVVVLFIVNLVVGVEQLVNDVGVFRRQGLADLGTGVLGGGQAAHLDEPVEGDAVPFAHVVDLVPQLFQLLRRIVDEGGKLVPVRPGNGGLKQFVDLLPHHAGGGV